MTSLLAYLLFPFKTTCNLFSFSHFRQLFKPQNRHKIRVTWNTRFILFYPFQTTLRSDELRRCLLLSGGDSFARGDEPEVRKVRFFLSKGHNLLHVVIAVFRPLEALGVVYFYPILGARKTYTLGSRYPAVLVNRLYSLSGVNGRITRTDKFACNVLVIRPIWRPDNKFGRITSTA